MTNHHDNNIESGNTFNEHGIDGIISRKHNHSAQKITDENRKTNSAYNIHQSEKIRSEVLYMVFTCFSRIPYGK